MIIDKIYSKLETFDRKVLSIFRRLREITSKVGPFNYLERKCFFCKKKFKVVTLVLPDNTSLYRNGTQEFKDRFHSEESFIRAVQESHRISLISMRGVAACRRDLYFYILPFFQLTFCSGCDKQDALKNRDFIATRTFGSMILSFFMFIAVCILYGNCLSYIDNQPQSELFGFLFTVFYWGLYLIGTMRVLFFQGISTISRNKF